MQSVSLQTTPIVRPCGRYHVHMGCVLWIQSLIYVPRPLMCFMQYRVILNHVILGMDCTYYLTCAWLFRFHESRTHACRTIFSMLLRRRHCFNMTWIRPDISACQALIVWKSMKHDDVIKWKHFPRYWPLVRGFTGQWHGTLMFSLIFAWIKGWVNNGEAGDLRRYRAHYDVIVMINPLWPSDAILRQWTGRALFRAMACRLFGAKTLPAQMMSYCQILGTIWQLALVKLD